MRHHNKDDIVVLDDVILRPEDVLEDGNGAQTGNAVPVVLLLVVLNAAQNAGFTLAQPNRLVDHALADDRLRHSADGLRSAFG